MHQRQSIPQKLEAAHDRKCIMAAQLPASHPCAEAAGRQALPFAARQPLLPPQLPPGQPAHPVLALPTRCRPRGYLLARVQGLGGPPG